MRQPITFNMPSSFLRLVVLALAFGLLIALVQFNILAAAFEKLGLSAEAAYVLFLATLTGSLINLPLFRLRAGPGAEDVLFERMGIRFRIRRTLSPGSTVIAVNVGGCLVPVCFSIYLMLHSSVSMWQTLIAVATVAGVAYVSSRPIAGVGVGMPIFIAPLSAVLIATLLNYEERAPLAYICGTIGVLLGADVFRLKDIRSLGAPIASIGGAGTFDGVFLAGLMAVLLT